LVEKNSFQLGRPSYQTYEDQLEWSMAGATQRVGPILILNQNPSKQANPDSQKPVRFAMGVCFPGPAGKAGNEKRPQ
jgi:hypothetical protein